MYVDNPNILILARKLEQIPNVLQVRFHAPLRQSVIELAGEGCMIFKMVVRDLAQTNEEYTALQSLVPKVVIDDETCHPGVIDNVTQMIERYQLTQEMPRRLGVGANHMVNFITTSSLFEQYQPEDIAPPGVFPSI